MCAFSGRSLRECLVTTHSHRLARLCVSDGEPVGATTARHRLPPANAEGGCKIQAPKEPPKTTVRHRPTMMRMHCVANRRPEDPGPPESKTTVRHRLPPERSVRHRTARQRQGTGHSSTRTPAVLSLCSHTAPLWAGRLLESSDFAC